MCLWKGLYRVSIEVFWANFWWKYAPLKNDPFSCHIYAALAGVLLNSNARAELMKTYYVNNNSCYPNTISEALSLLVTFKMEPTINNNMLGPGETTRNIQNV
jgi:hypothetical protein